MIHFDHLLYNLNKAIFDFDIILYF